MANTTNLGLGKLTGSEKLKTYPTVQAGNMDTIDTAFGAGFGVSGKPTVNASINNLADGLAIISNNNTHAAITAGQFVYVRNHGSLSEGLYVATANISANGTLSGSNLTADTSGGLNALSSEVSNKVNTSDRVVLDRNVSTSLLDCNSTTDPGMYRIINTTSNRPFNYGILTDLKSNDYKAQMAIPVTGESLYIRGKSSSDWGSSDVWNKIVPQDNMGVTGENQTINFDTEGRFLVYVDMSNSTGTKPGSSNGYLITITRSANAALQLFFGSATSSKTISMRTKYGGSWGDWRSVTLS